MKTVRELHDEAMRLSQLAYVARESGSYDKAKSLSARAFVLEAEAASLVPDGPRAEPTRSILYRSAASLAYQSRQLLKARRMIALGLAGDPPPQVQHELDDLYQQIHFELTLEEESRVIEDAQLDMHLIGDLVGYGAVLYDSFMDRLQALRQLLLKTTQRLSGRDYQGRGRIADEYKVFEPYLQLAPQSFVITLKLVRAERSQLSMFFSAEDVVREIMNGMRLINEGRQSDLRTQFASDAYYRHFVSQTRSRIAPDGQQIQLVQFNTAGSQVNLTRTREAIPAPASSTEHPDREREESVTVEGILDYAKSRKRDVLGLTTDDRKTYDIVVDEGLDELVLSYWKQYVSVSGILTGKKRIQLTDIVKADSPPDTHG